MGGGRRQEAAETPSPGPSSAPSLQFHPLGFGVRPPPSRLLTHLLQEDWELQAELLLKLGVPREERHVHHHLPGSR